MADEILTAAGITHKETRFLVPPQETYAVWLKEESVRGPDEKNLICVEDFTIELYAKRVDPAAEASIEAELMTRAIQYDKSERIWLASEELFQTVYSYEITRKRR